MMSRFQTAIRNAVDGRACVVALGGGADSAVLLHATIEAVSAGQVRAVFARHGLASSELLETAVRGLADSLGVDLTFVDALVRDGPDLEARARHARYAAIEANLVDGELALTGHTADDQAETVLMRLMRGSGAGGLSGIPGRRGVWVRPFLAFRRSELRAAAEQLGLVFVDDPANTDDRFLRSRIRHRLLPEIAEHYAPGIVDDLTRTATLLARDDAYLESASSWIRVGTFMGHVALPSGALVSAPLPESTRAIRSALRRCGDVYPGSAEDVESVLEVARTGATAVIGGDIHVIRQASMVVLATSDPLPCDTELEITRADSFPWGNHLFTVTRPTYPVPQSTAGRFTVIASPLGSERISVRPLLPGDRIDIGSGSTPVAELLRDHGVDRRARSCWLVIANDGKIAAVHGVRTAAWARPHNGDDIMLIEGNVHS